MGRERREMGREMGREIGWVGMRSGCGVVGAGALGCRIR